MKTVYIIRHAKSSWADASLSDFDRPLNKRGNRDAKRMADLFVLKQIRPHRIVTSTAKRAQETNAYFAEAIGIPDEHIIEYQELYHASMADILNVIHGLDDGIDTILLFGHNPGFTYLVNEYLDGYLDNLPTCGVFKVVGRVDHWSEFSHRTASAKDYFFPKELW